METLNNIAKVITDQLKFAQSNGKEITNELINTYYNEIATANVPPKSEIFTKYDIQKYQVNKIVKSSNFQFLITDKGVIITNKFF